MSSMLNQAIIDAKALKEAAIKNAENLVIEKYASEIKEAVNSLLEAPEDEVFDEDPLGLNAAEAEDPMEEPLGAESDINPVVDELPDSFKSAEGGQIEINLDQLSAEVSQAMGEMEAHEEAAEDMAAAPLQEPPSAQPTAPAPAAPMAENNEEEVNESDDEEINESDEDVNEASEEEITEDEEIEIDESKLLDILEKMIVDAEPTKSGWMNRSDKELQHEEDLALAKEAASDEADEDVNEENEEIKAELAEANRQNEILASASLKLQNENEKFRTAIIDLKESLERTNLSNAKLLYINQTLTNASLNERQKQRIVEAISTTETVKEAKVIFDTLQGTVGTSTKESIPQSLSEAVSRKPSLMVAARKQQQKTENNSPLFDRMQRLAGIKN
mgnify:FL=1|tara:strand:- start:424 stop:1590 length:1167 start_codon:yes stop_codon:yes gene_type:complete